uniref:Secreted protein n=1 Tax=Kalanchoe fedtschenkoi TaxID=63787 RepID=A0A7N0T788_KALFE
MSAGLSLSSVSFSSAAALSSVASAAAWSSCFGLCLVEQSRQLIHSTDSMRLWPKRNSSGAECFNGFHIGRFFYLFLFFRSPIT